MKIIMNILLSILQKKTKLEKNFFNVNKIIFNKEFSRIKINSKNLKNKPNKNEKFQTSKYLRINPKS
jgi:hypothetical protein